MEQRRTIRLAPLCGVLGLLCLAAAVQAAVNLDLDWLEWFNNGIGQFGPPLGSAGDRIAAAVMLGLLGALALFLLIREGADRSEQMTMLLPIGAALLLRAVCLDYASGDFNNFLSHWMEYFRANGGFAAIAGSVGDYNVPYLYFLAAASYLKLPDLYVIKLFSILFDVLLAWGGFRLVNVLRGKRAGDRAPFAAFGILLLLPTVVLNGSLWGQCDAIYAALCVHALALALEGKNVPSVVLLAAAFSFKLQTVFLMPLWGALWLSKRVRFRELMVFPLAYLITILPALRLGKPLEDILGVYFGQMGEYSDRLVLNAPSAYQFIPVGAEVDKGLAARVGVLAAFALVLVLLGIALRLGRRMDGGAAMAMAVVLVIGVPFLLPHMHERYFILADTICLCWACAGWRRFPAAVLAEGASLTSYFVYLRLKYNYVLTLGRYQFVMGLEALAMLIALGFGVAALAMEVKRCVTGPTEEPSASV